MNRVLALFRRAVLTAIAFFIGATAVFGLPALAQTTALDRLQRTSKGIYSTSKPQSLEQIIGGVIQTLLGIMGIVLLIYVIYGGYLWMTAQGDDQKVGKARKIISNTVVGIAIIFLAYFLTKFIINELVLSSTGQNLQGQAGSPGVTPR